MAVAGVANRQHIAGHRNGQRDVGPVLRAGRVHGRPGGRDEHAMRGQRPVDAGRGQAEGVRGAHDQAGRPVPAGVVGRHRAPAVRGSRARAGGHRRVPERGDRDPSRPVVPAEGVAQRLGQSVGGRRLAILRQFAVLRTLPDTGAETLLTRW